MSLLRSICWVKNKKSAPNKGIYFFFLFLTKPCKLTKLEHQLQKQKIAREHQQLWECFQDQARPCLPILPMLARQLAEGTRVKVFQFLRMCVCVWNYWDRGQGHFATGKVYTEAKRNKCTVVQLCTHKRKKLEEYKLTL